MLRICCWIVDYILRYESIGRKQAGRRSRVQLSGILMIILASRMMRGIDVTEAFILSSLQVHGTRAGRYSSASVSSSWKIERHRSTKSREWRSRGPESQYAIWDADAELGGVYTLLIDNYDSYTYNLFQQLAVINGRPPFVVYNDGEGCDLWRVISRMGQMPDNIVISPGPGRPDVPGDFGMCIQALREAVDVPILGVCLGHEGLGLVHGATVAQAREPMHGRLSSIFHDGDPLFHGVPQGTQVVRYHSLVVDPATLPADGSLIPTAWTTHGELMGIKHKGYPHWGVQFHPESVGTKYGADIMRNFRDLTLRWWRRRARPAEISNEAIVESGPRAWLASGTRNTQPFEGNGELGDRADLDATMFASPDDVTITRERDARGAGSACAPDRKPLVLYVRELATGGTDRREKDEGLVSMPDPETVFRAVYADSPTAWWLDSSSQQPGVAVDGQAKARFSFMGDADGPLSRIIECYADDLLIVKENKPEGGSESRQVRANVLEYLKAEMAKAGGDVPDPEKEAYVEVRLAKRRGRVPNSDDKGGREVELPFEFVGGYVGFLGYELRDATSDVLERSVGGSEWRWQAPGGRGWEHASFDTVGVDSGDTECFWLPNELDVPLGFLVFADRFVAFDHRERKVYLLALETAETAAVINGHGGEGRDILDPRTETVEWIDKMTNALHATLSPSRPGDRINSEVKRTSVSVEDVESMGDGVAGTVCTMDIPRSSYERSLGEIMRLVEEGETYEVCLTNQVVCKHTGDGNHSPLDLYARLRRSNPAPYAAYLIHDPRGRLMPGTGAERAAEPGGPSFAVCCSSPERFLKVDRSGWVESKPIKGTVKRGSTPEEDLALADGLARGEKNAAENLMIVDLLRNDLGRVCRTGSITVPKLMHVESYATVHQLVSTIRGRLRKGCGALDAIATAFPGGSMTGAPKRRTMDIIDRLEMGRPRGVYSGTVGFLSLDGAADLNIVIRTAVVTPQNITVGAGGAVVALSDIEEEYEEMLLKASSVLAAIGHVWGSMDPGAIARRPLPSRVLPPGMTERTQARIRKGAESRTVEPGFPTAPASSWAGTRGCAAAGDLPIPDSAISRARGNSTVALEAVKDLGEGRG